MSKPFRTALTWTIPTLFVLVYALYPYRDLPRPYYAPELRQILWDKPADVITQGWYGRVLMAGAISIVLGALAAWGVSRWPKAARTRLGPWLLGGATIAAMVITALHEMHRWMGER